MANPSQQDTIFTQTEPTVRWKSSSLEPWGLTEKKEFHKIIVKICQETWEARIDGVSKVCVPFWTEEKILLSKLCEALQVDNNY